MPKRSRSRSPSGDTKNILKVLKKLEQRMNSLEKQKTKRLCRSSSSSVSSDFASSLERHHSRRKHNRYYTSDGSSEKIPNEEEIGPCNGEPGQGTTSASPSGNATSIPTSNLNDNILSVLGDEIGITKVYGPPIHQQIADRWLHIFKSGLECDKRKDLILKYPAPDNSRYFEAPKLNPMVKQAINDSVMKRDERLTNKQVQIGVAISAIGSVISELLGKQEGGDDNKAIIERLSDSGRLLSDLHHSESVTRRELVSLNLNKDWKDTLSQSISDEWLFGEDLEERIKQAKTIQQSSNQLKPTKLSPRKAYTARSSLNSKSPLKKFRGTTQSGRYQQVSSTKYHQPNRPRRQEKYTTDRRYRRK